MRAILTQMAQAITTQAQATTVKAQATTMASRLRDFSRMNPTTFYGSKVDEDP